MAVITIQFSEDRFTNLVNGPSSTNLVLLLSLGIAKGDTLIIEEVDSLGNPTLRTAKGTVSKIADGQFYNLPIIYNQYFITVLDMAPWIDYSTASTVVGWSSLSIKIIRYRIEGKTLFWNVVLFGVANVAATSFTLPLSIATGLNSVIYTNLGRSNSILSLDPTCIVATEGSNVMVCYRTLTLLGYSGAGNKAVYGNGFFEID